MDTENYVFVDTKRIDAHLSILQNELKETTILIEMLKNVYQMAENKELVYRQLQYVKKEKECIQRRIEFLKNAINKFTYLKGSIASDLEDAIETMMFLGKM